MYIREYNGDSFAIGDTVAIKSWDELKAEFGLRDHGFKCDHLWFLPVMRQYCGIEFVIKDFIDNQCHEVVFENNETGFRFNLAMIKPVTPGDIDVAELESLICPV